MITEKQYRDAKDIILQWEYEQGFLSIAYLKRLHPELNEIEVSEYLEFCRGHTIYLKQCYGDGSKMMPLYKEYLKTK